MRQTESGSGVTPPSPIHSPQTSVHGCRSPGDDFGDEDARVIWNVGVVDPSCYAEAEAGVTLRETTGGGCPMRPLPRWQRRSDSSEPPPYSIPPAPGGQRVRG